MKKQILTLISWNVNGIRAVIKKGFTNFLTTYQPDILALQEVKINDTAREKEQFDFVEYTEFWNPADKPGYSGTAVFVHRNFLAKNPILSTTYGIGEKKFDSEGRVITLEFDKFYFVNAYFPNTREDLSRLDFKIEFNDKIFKHIKKLENPSTHSTQSKQAKPVIFTGDFNVAHTEIDLARPQANEKNAGYTIEERTSFDKFLKTGMIDTFRYLNPKKIQYTWWTYRFGARSRNVGWRIDYFITSKTLAKNIIEAKILNEVIGSDHCPIELKVESL